MPKHTGKSDEGFSEAVQEALKNVPGGGSFTVELEVTLSPNPGTINYIVRLNPVTG